MLKETLNKGISTPITIGVILILVILVGSFTWWQYGEMWRERDELPELELPEKEGESRIKVVFPNGEEQLITGKTYDITWESQKVDKVYIYLVKEEESDVAEIITKDFVQASLGKYSWKIPINSNINLGGQFKIVIFSSEEKNGKIRDESDNYFSIIKNETAGWETYTSEEYRFEFRYPPDFSWIPGFKPKIIPIECEYANFSEGCPYIKFNGSKVEKEQALKKGIFKIEQMTINEVPYCFWSWSEGAAGSSYEIYYYSAVKDEECFAVNLVLKYINCGVFSPEEDKYKECEESNVTKTNTLNKMLSTFKFID